MSYDGVVSQDPWKNDTVYKMYIYGPACLQTYAIHQISPLGQRINSNYTITL
jgi:hypothetical protein